MSTIQKGFRCKLDEYVNTSSEINVDVTASGTGGYDYSCFGVDSSDKLSDDRYMVFYNQTSSPSNEIVLSQNGSKASYRIQLFKLPATVNKLVFTVSIDGSGTMKDISRCSVNINQAGSPKLTLELTGKDFQREKAIIAIEIYRKDVWRLAAVAAGFNGGLSDLLKQYGGEEAAPPPITAPAKVSLTKITLEKQGDKHTINLSKNSGEIVVNLNWTQPQQPAKQGFWASLAGNGEIDLDLGCFYELRDGTKTVIDGLQFSKGRGGPRNRITNQGCYISPPWIWHSGDDRSGSVSEGESIFVNPQGMTDLKRMIVYCFIYQGAARWAETNAVVTVKVPGSPDVSIEMGKQNDAKTFCAVAEIGFDGSNSMTIKKLVTFHNGHADCDRMYNWGLRWGAGSK